MKETHRLPVCWFDVKGCAEFGKKEFVEALAGCGVLPQETEHWVSLEKTDDPVLAVGTIADRRIRILLENGGPVAVYPPESVLCQWRDTPKGRVLVLAGSDDIGLMYLLLDLARKIREHGFSALRDIESDTESPQNRVRGMDRYLLGHLDNEWFLSEDFWRYYLARLARARFNRFCLILGFDTAYMAPPYPFFLSVPGYEQVKAIRLSAEDMEKNLAALRRIGRLCHEHGISFALATWQQRPWTAEQDRLVEGLPEEEKALGDYCYAGLKALIAAVPEIDVVQFRVNHESGVGDQVSAADFWNRCADAVADVAKETGRPLILDLRAKGLTDSMIAHAFSRGLQVEVPTKFWCEHAALPYHLSVMRSEELAKLDNFNHSRRYSYANLLKKPRYFDVLYRLWNYGSTNLFLWGDADYARRFSKSCGLSGSAGFEVNAPLSLKYGHELSHKEPWHTFADPKLRSGDWEDERFWLWYTVFGRLGYDPDADPEIWAGEFRQRFGERAAPEAERALAAASRIVPLITTIHMPVHPSLRYWTELNTGWALFAENNLNRMKDYDFETGITYGSTEPSDHGLFYGIDEYAADAAGNRLSGKYSPLQTAQRLCELAEETERGVAEATALTENGAAPEFLAMTVDTAMLCGLARYHAQKMRAALALAFWRVSGNPERLSDAAVLLDSAAAHWKALADLGLKAYHRDLNFSSAGSETRRGTWADLTCELEADQKTMAALLRENGIEPRGTLYGDYRPAPVSGVEADFPEKIAAGRDLKIAAHPSGICPADAAPVLHYRHTDQTEGLFHALEMTLEGDRYSAVIPGSYITGEWDLMVYVTVQEDSGSCAMFPGVYHPVYPYPYHVIEVTKEGSGL